MKWDMIKAEEDDRWREKVVNRETWKGVRAGAV